MLLIKNDPSSDQSPGGPSRHRQERVGLGTSLHRAGLVTIRAVAQTLLADQLQESWQIRPDPPGVVEMALLERPHGVQRPLEAEPPPLDLLDSGGLGHDPTDQ